MKFNNEKKKMLDILISYLASRDHIHFSEGKFKVNVSADEISVEDTSKHDFIFYIDNNYNINATNYFSFSSLTPPLELNFNETGKVFLSEETISLFSPGRLGLVQQRVTTSYIHYLRENNFKIKNIDDFFKVYFSNDSYHFGGSLGTNIGFENVLNSSTLIADCLNKKYRKVFVKIQQFLSVNFKKTLSLVVSRDDDGKSVILICANRPADNNYFDRDSADLILEFLQSNFKYPEYRILYEDISKEFDYIEFKSLFENGLFRSPLDVLITSLGDMLNDSIQNKPDMFDYIFDRIKNSNAYKDFKEKFIERIKSDMKNFEAVKENIIQNNPEYLII